LNIPQGYDFAVAAAGFKKPGRPDFGLIVSRAPAVAAGTFTRNLFRAAPVNVAMDILTKSSTVRAVVVNSGQANACTGEPGQDDCRRTLDMTARVANLSPGEILPASTGVIGTRLKLDLWEKALPGLIANLGHGSPEDLARAMMTTDTFPKLASAEAETPDGRFSVLGLAKGAGMICPNMATMLGFVMTDAEVDPAWWRDALGRAVANSFNSITVDGDTSTNDCVLALANGASGVRPEGPGLEVLQTALEGVCRDLAYMIVKDGEGATKVVRIAVSGAADRDGAETAARTVAHSPLVKTAMFGGDPNWGRIVAALGRSGARFNPGEVSVTLCGIRVFEKGLPVDLDLDREVAPLLEENEIDMEISLGRGPGAFELLTCDLGYDYVRINADYRT